MEKFLSGKKFDSDDDLVRKNAAASMEVMWKSKNKEYFHVVIIFCFFYIIRTTVAANIPNQYLGEVTRTLSEIHKRRKIYFTMITKTKNNGCCVGGQTANFGYSYSGAGIRCHMVEKN